MQFFAMARKFLLLSLFVSGITYSTMLPIEVFLPRVNLLDSLSAKYTYPRGQVSNVFCLPRERDSRGNVTNISMHFPSQDGSVDSNVIELEWVPSIPVILADPQVSALRWKQSSHRTGVPSRYDSAWGEWDAVAKTLVHRSSNQDSGCAWVDSTKFDDLDRLIYRSSCSNIESDSGGAPLYYTYRAWYESPTDTLPRWSSYHDDLPTFDSMVSFGPANRPDSLGGTRRVSLVRDAKGKVVESVVREVAGDTSRFEYDELGRVAKIVSTDPDEGYVLDASYSWSDGVPVRPRTSMPECARWQTGHLRLDLAAPDLVRVERISLDGKRLGILLDGHLPAGRSLLPVSVDPGDLVRIRTSRGRTILVAPPR